MLDGRLLVLKLVLEELGYDTDISSVEKRKRDQKAVYLAQISGVDLGYRYGWYLMGPYSTGLARDYYALSKSSALDDEEGEQSLKRSIREKIRNASTIIRSPSKPDQLDEIHWLELLASWHYLRNISRKSEADAADIIRREKPNLAGYIEVANEALADANL